MLPCLLCCPFLPRLTSVCMSINNDFIHSLLHPHLWVASVPCKFLFSAALFIWSYRFEPVQTGWIHFKHFLTRTIFESCTCLCTPTWCLIVSAMTLIYINCFLIPTYVQHVYLEMPSCCYNWNLNYQDGNVTTKMGIELTKWELN